MPQPSVRTFHRCTGNPEPLCRCSSLMQLHRQLSKAEFPVHICQYAPRTIYQHNAGSVSGCLIVTVPRSLCLLVSQSFCIQGLPPVPLSLDLQHVILTQCLCPASKCLSISGVLLSLTGSRRLCSSVHGVLPKAQQALHRTSGSGQHSDQQPETSASEPVACGE